MSSSTCARCSSSCNSPPATTSSSCASPSPQPFTLPIHPLCKLLSSTPPRLSCTHCACGAVTSPRHTASSHRLVTSPRAGERALLHFFFRGSHRAHTVSRVGLGQRRLEPHHFRHAARHRAHHAAACNAQLLLVLPGVQWRDAHATPGH